MLTCGRLPALILAVTAVPPLPAEIIDRIAVTVAQNVITESEIIRQIRITSFLNDTVPDLSPDSKRDVADRLVDQTLLRRELQTSRYPMADPSVAEPVVASLKKERFPKSGEFEQALRQYRITERDLRDAIQWQVTTLRFIDMRFRPGIQVPDTEVKDYYEKQFLPEYAKTKAEGAPSLEESREAIEKILTDQRVDRAVDRWLGQARTQTRIKYLQEVFR